MELSAIQSGAASARAALDGLEAGRLGGLRGDRQGGTRDATADAEAAKQLESVFARMLVRELRRALPEGPFGGGAGADVYEGWFDEHLGQALVERDALGLAGLVKTGIGRAVAAEAENA